MIIPLKIDMNEQKAQEEGTAEAQELTKEPEKELPVRSKCRAPKERR